MGTSYEKDVVAWAQEQAELLRSGQLSALDIEHLAEEIETSTPISPCLWWRLTRTFTWCLMLKSRITSF